MNRLDPSEFLDIHSSKNVPSCQKLTPWLRNCHCLVWYRPSLPFPGLRLCLQQILSMTRQISKWQLNWHWLLFSCAPVRKFVIRQHNHLSFIAFFVWMWIYRACGRVSCYQIDLKFTLLAGTALENWSGLSVLVSSCIPFRDSISPSLPPFGLTKSSLGKRTYG